MRTYACIYVRHVHTQPSALVTPSAPPLTHNPPPHKHTAPPPTHIQVFQLDNPGKQTLASSSTHATQRRSTLLPKATTRPARVVRTLCTLNKQQRAQYYTLAPGQVRYNDMQPLHVLWQRYAAGVLLRGPRGDARDARDAQEAKALAVLDLHGAHMHVVSTSASPSLVGCKVWVGGWALWGCAVYASDEVRDVVHHRG